MKPLYHVMAYGVHDEYDGKIMRESLPLGTIQVFVRGAKAARARGKNLEEILRDRAVDARLVKTWSKITRQK